MLNVHDTLLLVPRIFVNPPHHDEIFCLYVLSGRHNDKAKIQCFVMGPAVIM